MNCRFAGQVEDMSASGLRLRLDRPAPIGPDASLTLILGSGTGLVEVKARVVWTRTRGPGQELGLAFADPGPRTRAALFNLVWTGPDASGPASSLQIAGHG